LLPIDETGGKPIGLVAGDETGGKPIGLVAGDETGGKPIGLVAGDETGGKPIGLGMDVGTPTDVITGEGGMVAAGAFGSGRVAMTTPTMIPIITNMTITITAIGGPPLGALTEATLPSREFIYNLNSEISSSKLR
jgi:hypothetical protein